MGAIALMTPTPSKLAGLERDWGGGVTESLNSSEGGLGVTGRRGATSPMPPQQGGGCLWRSQPSSKGALGQAGKYWQVLGVGELLPICPPQQGGRVGRG